MTPSSRLRWTIVVLAAVAGWQASGAESGALLRPPERGRQTVTLLFENDLFGDTDQQYTNGLKLSWMSPDLKRLGAGPPVPGWLAGLLGRLTAFENHVVGSDARQFNVGFALGQMMFTPEDTRAEAPVTDDRPYAGWLYGSVALVSRTERVADTLELHAGVIGPASFAEDAQRFVHDIRDIPTPRGWDHQLRNEPGLVVYYERKWRVFQSTIAERLDYDLIAHLGAAVGNVADYGAAGAELRIGWNLPRDFGTSLIRPGGDANAPGAAGGVRGSGDVGMYVFAALGGRLVGRDIFLDGNTFTDSHSVDRKPLVADFVVGASVVYRALKLSYAQVFRTAEFGERDRRHNFGSVNVSVSF